jgi:hypothetical protein
MGKTPRDARLLCFRGCPESRERRQADEEVPQSAAREPNFAGAAAQVYRAFSHQDPPWILKGLDRRVQQL